MRVFLRQPAKETAGPSSAKSTSLGMTPLRKRQKKRMQKHGGIVAWRRWAPSSSKSVAGGVVVEVHLKGPRGGFSIVVNFTLFCWGGFACYGPLAGGFGVSVEECGENEKQREQSAWRQAVGAMGPPLCRTPARGITISIPYVTKVRERACRLRSGRRSDKCLRGLRSLTTDPSPRRSRWRRPNGAALRVRENLPWFLL